jgi:uncharacterized membrane protein
MNLKTARTLASAAAVFAMASATTLSIAHAQDSSSAAKVQCFGVNSCKGTSDCKSGNHDCKGQNDCKGQGFKAESAKACAAQHGSTTPPGQ